MKNELVEKWSQLATQWKIAVVVGLVIILIIPITMCGRNEPIDVTVDKDMQEEIEKSDDEDSEEDKEPEEPKEPNYRAPLTFVGADQPIDNRPYAALIENSSQARPQSGLDKADIVYEVLAEGAITRFVAIFQSQFPDSIGPIRSAREYMLDVAGDYDAVIVHAGGSPGALNRISREQLPSLSEIANGAYYKRESFRKAPHNVYTNKQLLDEGVKARNFRSNYTLPSIAFTLDKTPRGDEAVEVVIPYSSNYIVKYRYSEHTGNYHRFMNNMPHNDYLTNQQLQATNVFIIYARHSVMDNEGRLNVNLKSSGKGYAVQKGKIQEITWRHTDGMIRFYLGNQEVERYPGSTWVQVVPDLVAVSVQD